MASTTDDKNHLIREMRLARERFDFNSASLRRDLDIPARTRRSVSGAMRIWAERPLRMYDAVVVETPARAATSSSVTLRVECICGLLSSTSTKPAQNRGTATSS